MRKVVLTLKEQKKYDVIKELVIHNGCKKRVTLKLCITEWQINCLIIIYKKTENLVLCTLIVAKVLQRH